MSCQHPGEVRHSDCGLPVRVKGQGSVWQPNEDSRAVDSASPSWECLQRPVDVDVNRPPCDALLRWRTVVVCYCTANADRLPGSLIIESCRNSAMSGRVPDLLQAAQQVLRYDVAEVRPVSLRDIRLAERERDRDARQLQQQVRAQQIGP